MIAPSSARPAHRFSPLGALPPPPDQALWQWLMKVDFPALAAPTTYASIRFFDIIPSSFSRRGGSPPPVLHDTRWSECAAGSPTERHSARTHRSTAAALTAGGSRSALFATSTSGFSSPIICGRSGTSEPWKSKTSTIATTTHRFRAIPRSSWRKRSGRARPATRRRCARGARPSAARSCTAGVAALADHRLRLGSALRPGRPRRVLGHVARQRLLVRLELRPQLAHTVGHLERRRQLLGRPPQPRRRRGRNRR